MQGAASQSAAVAQRTSVSGPLICKKKAALVKSGFGGVMFEILLGPIIQIIEGLSLIGL